MNIQTKLKFGFLAASLFALHQVNAQQKQRAGTRRKLAFSEVNLYLNLFYGD